MRELDEVRGIVVALELLEDELANAVIAARAAGADGVTLADALGVARSTLYRRYLDETEGRSRAGRRPVTCDAEAQRRRP